MDNIIEFLEAFIKPTWDIAMAILSYPLFGFPLWQHILSFYIISFVIGFIVHGQISLGASTVAGGISRASESAQKAKLDRQEKERKSRIGFRG